MFAGLHHNCGISPTKPTCIWGPELQLGESAALNTWHVKVLHVWCWDLCTDGKLRISAFHWTLGFPAPPYPMPSHKSTSSMFPLGPGKPVELVQIGQTVSAPGEEAQVALQLALGLTRWPSRDSELPPPASCQLWHQGRPHQGEPPHASTSPCCQNIHQPDNTWIQAVR